MKISKKYLVGSIIFLLVTIPAGYWFFYQTKNADNQNLALVKKGNITQEVSVTGRVNPKTTIDLGFERSGRIQNIQVRVGDHVRQGALLAEMESGGAHANLMEAEARLRELRRGSRPEEIAIKKTEIAKYEQDLANSYSGSADTINDAFIKADDALHVKTAGIFSGFKTTTYKLTYSMCDSQLDIDTTSLRYATEIDFNIWRTESASLPLVPSNTELLTALGNTHAHLEKVKSLLEKINQTLILDCTVSNTDLNTYRDNINVARAVIAAVLSSVSARQQSIALLAITATKAKDELALLEAGTAS